MDAPEKTWLEERLASLNAVYKKFGRDGLREQPLEDVSLLLSSKELQLRDSARGHGISEQQQAANRRLELEIKDLSSYVNLRGLVAQSYGRGGGGRTYTPSRQQTQQQGRKP